MGSSSSLLAIDVEVHELGVDVESLVTSCIPCEGHVDVGVAGDEHELVAVGAEGLGHEEDVPVGVAANEGVLVAAACAGHEREEDVLPWVTSCIPCEERVDVDLEVLGLEAAVLSWVTSCIPWLELGVLVAVV